MSRRFILTITLIVAAAPGAAGVAQAFPLASARLQGQFLMHGRVTATRGVPGEHVGERVRRTWTFTPLCPAGPCARVLLTRARRGGSDTLVLRKRAPARYLGDGAFYAPLRCGRRTYARGERVPFTITIRVTDDALAAGVLVATGVRATYASQPRVNLTRCVLPPRQEAAVYRGGLIAAPAPPSARSASEPASSGLSGRSPAGS